MARPHVICQDALLQSIRETFLEHGPGASTSQLATHAGVSEGTLFKRFGNKQRMFELAMVPPVLAGRWFEDMLDYAGEGDLRQHLVTIANGITSHIIVMIPRVLCAHGGRAANPDESRKLFSELGSPTHHVRQRLTRFFEIEVAAGRVKPMPARHLANLFHGALHHHVVLSIIFPEETGGALPTAFSQELAETFHALVALP